jgi:hypothetical protein
MTRKPWRAKPDTVEVISPDLPTPVDTVDDQNVHAGDKDRTVRRLDSIGDIRREMAAVYRAAHRGVIAWEEATKRIWVLRGILQTIEVEKRYRVPDFDPDERPVFAGLTISGPAMVKPNGSGPAS